MASRITALAEPGSFVDEQVSGPLASFRHEHRFEGSVDGGTAMTDILDVRAPLGPLDWLAEQLFLRRCLRRLIEVRNDFLLAEQL
ncbi:hypothetical protein [Psychromicrobium xiongbiense]|uniref:hypothetical protein n=1 Tax=Psychromicrobium xiongbiense TaxID=3051184 RepID=UPI0025575296|nr:hypothetical protein [Psychromicrobium sp. YIM S02556]